ncbi:MAG TPA: zinc-binding dehydrogenase [Symbiobacteriaceae bacterium]|nr:zinc-binding dehydrogenase [Symbiobacteriaceae bacterium]
MKAVEFEVGAFTYVMMKVLGRLNRRLFFGPLSGVRFREMPEPALPGPDWVKIRTRYGGICGSDLNMVFLHDSPSASPFASMPFVVGHENLGTIVEAGQGVTDFAPGDRVVADPVLACATRGIAEPCPSCARGDYSTCTNFNKGTVKPGMSIGLCQSTGGSWGEYYVAHRSQLIRVPDRVSDEDAILIDPLASALHPVMRHFPKDSDQVLIIGGGIIGLLVVACLRALGSKARITLLARYPFQAELAKQQGADRVLLGRGDYFAGLAEICDGELLKPILGKRIVQGGFNMVYDCVGSDTSLDDSLRFTAPAGKMVLVGLASLPSGVDWTPMWLKEITVAGVVYCSTEEYDGRRLRTYELGMQLIEQGRVSTKGLLTHTFPINQYKEALAVASDKKGAHSVKVAFRY